METVMNTTGLSIALPLSAMLWIGIYKICLLLI